MLKKLFTIITIVIVLVGSFKICSSMHYYRIDATVVSNINNVTTFKDTAGNLWRWCNEPGENWFENEKVSLKMWTPLTDRIVLSETEIKEITIK